MTPKNVKGPQIAAGLYYTWYSTILFSVGTCVYHISAIRLIKRTLSAYIIRLAAVVYIWAA